MSESIDILVGRIGRAHGIRGEVGIDVRTDEPERRFAPQTRFVTPRGPLTVAGMRWQGRQLLMRFREVGDRAGAEALKGIDLRLDVPADERPDDPEEFYDHQIVGLAAETEDGLAVGEVTDVLHLPAQDVLVLARRGGEAFVPFVREFVPTVDLEGRRLVIVDRPGLLEDED